MTPTTDEDWSIISSSDYEEDSPGSFQDSARGKQDQNQDRETRDDDLVNASVSTVKPNSHLQSTTSSGFCAESISLASGVAPDSSAGSDLDKPSGSGKAANGAGAQTAAPGAQASPCGKNGSARGGMRENAARAPPILSDTSGSTEKSMAGIFDHMPSASMLFPPGSKVLAVRKSACDFLYARRHVLLYVVLATAVFAFVGGALGTFPGIFPGIFPLAFQKKPESPFWASLGPCSMSCLRRDPWVQKTASMAANLKAKCGATVSKIWNTVLYEDSQKTSSFFGRLFWTAPSRKLRFSSALGSFHGHLNQWWTCVKGSRAVECASSLRKHLATQNVSDIWASVVARTHVLATDLRLQAKINHWCDTLASMSRQMFLGNEAIFVKNWNTFKQATQSGLVSGQERFWDSVELAEDWYARGGASNLTTSLVMETKKLRGNFTTGVDLCSSYLSRWTGYIERMAGDYKLHVDRANAEHLLHTLKTASRKRFNVMCRRFNIVALDAHRISKAVFASWKR